MRRRRDPNSELEEPLLGKSSEDEEHEARQPRTPVMSPRNSLERDRQNQAWQQLLGTFILSWAGWLKHLILGGRSMVFSIVGAITSMNATQSQKSTTPLEILPPIQLSPLQEERLNQIKARIGLSYDQNSPEHQVELTRLWKAVYPDREMKGEDEVAGWKEMGWQGNHPASDFRGGGLLSLENLIYFAETYPRAFKSLMLKQNGKRAEWEYPFAAAGVNLTVLLTSILDLRAAQPGTAAGRTFLRMLEGNERAFDDLYCTMFVMLDQQWLEMKASYMEFNVVLKSVQKLMEQELSNQKLCSVQDLYSFQSLVQ